MDATEYRLWWEHNTSVPYGFCWCGCGTRTTISEWTVRRNGYVKGEPRRYVCGHTARTLPPDLTEKRCVGCGVVKPSADFTPQRRSGHGLRPRCKECESHRTPEQRAALEERARLAALGLKRCSKCSEVKPMGGFYRRPRSGDGRTASCKECRSAEIRERKRTPEYRALRRAENHRRRAAVRRAPGSHTTEQWLALVAFYGDRCLRCGAEGATVDHVIPLFVGGSNGVENLQPLCKPCNSAKGVKVVDYREPERHAAFLASQALPTNFPTSQSRPNTTASTTAPPTT